MIGIFVFSGSKVIFLDEVIRAVPGKDRAKSAALFCCQECHICLYVRFLVHLFFSANVKAQRASAGAGGSPLYAFHFLKIRSTSSCETLIQDRQSFSCPCGYPSRFANELLIAIQESSFPVASSSYSSTVGYRSATAFTSARVRPKIVENSQSGKNGPSAAARRHAATISRSSLVRLLDPIILPGERNITGQSQNSGVFPKTSPRLPGCWYNSMRGGCVPLSYNSGKSGVRRPIALFRENANNNKPLLPLIVLDNHGSSGVRRQSANQEEPL